MSEQGLKVTLESLGKRLNTVLENAHSEVDLLLTELAAPPEPAPVLGRFQHLGELVRWLRETAGLTRLQLGEQTGLAAATIRNLDFSMHKPTAATMRKLLQAPCMAKLPEWTKEAGLDPVSGFSADKEESNPG